MSKSIPSELFKTKFTETEEELPGIDREIKAALPSSVENV